MQCVAAASAVAAVLLLLLLTHLSIARQPAKHIGVALHSVTLEG